LIRSRFHYWRRCLGDFLHSSPLVGRCASYALAALARLKRCPLRRLQVLTRAARVSPTLGRLRQLQPALETQLARLNGTAIDWNAAGGEATSQNGLPKGIILKPPVSEREKGVIYLTFEKQWLRLLRSGHVEDIARRYDLVLGPSFSPPPDLELLLMVRLWPGRLYTLLSNLGDADVLRSLSPRLHPVLLLASSWVDPAACAPHLSGTKDHDIVMLANFALFKRHWLFFDALRKLPARFRVLLMGVPLDGRGEKELMAEARTFGVQDRFELQVRPSRDEVMSALARSRTSLIFSQREGSCIAVTESLFANTPVGLFRDARIGSKAFINAETGVLLDRRGLVRQLCEFVDKADGFNPRDWACQHISCHASRAVLNDILRREAREHGQEWTRDLLPIRKDLVPAYLSVDLMGYCSARRPGPVG
jgi:glycosyltransferase involved in cell wall biosynthesis